MLIILVVGRDNEANKTKQLYPGTVDVHSLHKTADNGVSNNEIQNITFWSHFCTERHGLWSYTIVIFVLQVENNL